MGDSLPKAYLFFLPWKRSNGPHDNQDISQCPESLLQLKVQSFGAYRQLLNGHSPHPGSLACSQQLVISGSLLGPVYGAHTAMGHATARAAKSNTPGRVRKCTGQSITTWARETERHPPGGLGACGP